MGFAEDFYDFVRLRIISWICCADSLLLRDFNLLTVS